MRRDMPGSIAGYILDKRGVDCPYEAEYSGCRFETAPMVRIRPLASLVMLGSTLGSGLACGSAQPLGTAKPRAEAAPPSMEEPAASDPGAPDPDTAAWQALEDPVYVLTIRALTTGDIYHSFLVTVSDIGPGAQYDLERAVEIDTDT